MRISIVAIAVGLLGASLAWAQTSPPAGKSPAAAAPASDAKGPEIAIRQAGRAYVSALNSGDFKTALSYWAADGEFVDGGGQVFKARKIVGEELAKRFSGADRPQLAHNVKSLRLITPDSAVEDGSLEVKPAGGQTPRRGNYSAVWVKQQGKWLIHSIRESASTARTHDYSLSDLSWLAGRWQADDEGETIRMDCSWTPGKVFLLRDITIEREGKRVHSITQRIGLDPLSPKIKSWAFDANGGLAEAFWEKTGDGWQVFSKGATRSGHLTSAKNLYTDIGPNGFTLESLEAKLGSDSPPAFKLQFKRAGAPSSAPPSASAAASAEDSAARERILNSPEWHETQRAADEWLSVQKIYTPAEVKQVRTAMAAKIAKMSAPELQNFLDDSKEKFAILLSKQAEEARLWLAQRMAVEVKLTPEQLKQMRPNIVDMTAAQVEQRLMEMQAEREQTQQVQQAFDTGRKAQVKNIEQAEKQSEQEREAALDRAYSSAESAGGYYYGGGVPNNVGYRGGGWGAGFRY
jgi:uncharacterized protein (TIGR02246 family)